jgi:hypothetical protein
MANEETPFKLYDGQEPPKKKKEKDDPKEDEKPYRLLDPMSLATWARLRSAGAAPIGGKPNGAENMDQNPSVKRDKKRRRKLAKKAR